MNLHVGPKAALAVVSSETPASCKGADLFIASIRPEQDFNADFSLAGSITSFCSSSVKRYRLLARGLECAGWRGTYSKITSPGGGVDSSPKGGGPLDSGIVFRNDETLGGISKLPLIRMLALYG
jgi:hypothetical protein